MHIRMYRTLFHEMIFEFPIIFENVTHRTTWNSLAQTVFCFLSRQQNCFGPNNFRCVFSCFSASHIYLFNFAILFEFSRTVVVIIIIFFWLNRLRLRGPLRAVEEFKKSRETWVERVKIADASLFSSAYTLDAALMRARWKFNCKFGTQQTDRPPERAS